MLNHVLLGRMDDLRFNILSTVFQLFQDMGKVILRDVCNSPAILKSLIWRSDVRGTILTDTNLKIKEPITTAVDVLKI